MDMGAGQWAQSLQAPGSLEQEPKRPNAPKPNPRAETQAPVPVGQTEIERAKNLEIESKLPSSCIPEGRVIKLRSELVKGLVHNGVEENGTTHYAAITFTDNGQEITLKSEGKKHTNFLQASEELAKVVWNYRNTRDGVSPATAAGSATAEGSETGAGSMVGQTGSDTASISDGSTLVQG